MVENCEIFNCITFKLFDAKMHHPVKNVSKPKCGCAKSRHSILQGVQWITHKYLFLGYSMLIIIFKGTMQKYGCVQNNKLLTI